MFKISCNIYIALVNCLYKKVQFQLFFINTVEHPNKFLISVEGEFKFMLQLSSVGRSAYPQTPVLFTGKIENRFKQYGIDDLNAVTVKAAPGITLNAQEKKELVNQALLTYEHAAKKRMLNEYVLKQNPTASHISGRNFSTTIQLQSGVKATAVNSEFNREDILCGERSAIVSALNQAIQKIPFKLIQNNPTALEKASEGLQVKRLIMSGAHRQKGENPVSDAQDNLSSPAPCSDCLSWLSTDEYFSPDTQVVTLEKTLSPAVSQTPGQKPAFTLNIQTVQQLLPNWGVKAVSKSSQGIDALPVVISESAKGLLSQHPWFVGKQMTQAGLETMAKSLLQKAKTSYDTNPLTEVSKKNAAVATQFQNLEAPIAASRFDITARWYLEPGKTTLEKGFRKMQVNGLTTDPNQGAVAIAYAFYGDTALPTVNTLGHLSQLERGNGADQTLIINIENDKIQVKTIRDWMPQVYMSARIPREGGKTPS